MSAAVCWAAHGGSPRTRKELMMSGEGTGIYYVCSPLSGFKRGSNCSLAVLSITRRRPVNRLNSQLGLPSHFESTQGPQLLRRVGFLPASWFQVPSTAPHHPPRILVFSPASYSLLLLLLILLPPSSTPDLDTFTTHSPNRLTTAASNRKHGVLLPTLPVPARVHCPLLLREAHPCLWRWQHRRHLQDRGPEL